eukprot:jgi/Ulvmu1/10764/UM068_0054.1
MSLVGLLWTSALICLGADVSAAAPGKGARGKWGLNQIWNHAHESGHLPELSEPVRKPGQDNSVGICATMKDENSTDVREWLLYYRWLGVDHVYLTENAPTVPERMRADLRDFVSDGFLTLATEPIPRAQTKVYYDCMSSHYHKHNWLAFFDMDEYLVIVEKPEQKLPKFLEEYKAYAGLSVHWVIVGPSGHEMRAAAGGVLRHYTHCNAGGSPWIKTIANTYFLTNIAYHPHNFEYRDDMRSVDETGRPMRDYRDRVMFTVTPPARSSGAPQGDIPQANEHGLFRYSVPGFMMSPPEFKRIALYHYITKSKQDFVDKRSRGSGTAKIRTWDEFDDVSSTAADEGGICAIPSSVADKCCPERDYVLRQKP